MNLWLKPHFTAKIGQFFVPTSQKMRVCVDVIWRHSCSNVVLPIDMYIHIHIERVMPIYIYIYISIYWHHTFSDFSHCIEIYLVGDNRRTVNTSTVPTFLYIRVLNIVMLIYCRDARSGLQWYVLIWTSFWIFLPRSNNFRESCQSVGEYRLIEKLFLMK